MDKKVQNRQNDLTVLEIRIVVAFEGTVNGREQKRVCRGLVTFCFLI